MERFRRAVAAPETQRRIEKDKQDGERAGVEGTPSFFVNGRPFHEPPSALPAYIREELDQ